MPVTASVLAASLWTPYPMTAEAVEVGAEAVVVELQTFVVDAVPETAATVALSAVREDFEITWESPVQWPVAEGSAIGNGFGYRGAVCGGCSSNHLGLDLFPGYGQPVTAMADGVVRSVSSNGGWGVYISLDHEIDGQRVSTLYAHLVPGSPHVAPGDIVEVGDHIADVGNSGISTAPHLHFEVTIGGGHVDPHWWLRQNVLTEPAG